ncbi:uncharacterized protein LOC130740451 [Lotus japonicus]|uniref:uncharacterized protein LOC130740451 n=1 Tax=Lotus japonicus TaxID=34305 RepID=UPI002590E084|nr:uncharacterized protein LOC130740451 [Lotus japonicus]
MGGEDGWTRVNGGRKKAFNKRVNSNEVTSYFFTNFPDDFKAKNMWGVFSYWGRVQEVFIPTKTDRNGQRFGFVRFFDVHDPSGFGRRLDQIFIGSTKLFVNLPRFIGYPRSQGKASAKPRAANEVSRTDSPRNTNLSHSNHGISTQKSYADAVANGRTRSEIPPGGSGKQTEAIGHLPVDDTVDEWLAKSWVGRLKQTEMSQNIQETLLVGGFHSVRARYMGDDLVLLSSDPGVCWDDIVKGSEDWLANIFESINPWSPSIVMQSRVVWIRCYGIPLHLWKRRSFDKLISPLGEVLELDAATSEMDRVEFARMKIRTTRMGTFSDVWDMTINKITYGIRIVEEMPQLHQPCNCSHADSENDGSESTVWSFDGSENVKATEDLED